MLTHMHCFIWEQKFNTNKKHGAAGGQRPNPTYEEVCSGFTGHTEAVQVTYDPKEVKYEQ